MYVWEHGLHIFARFSAQLFEAIEPVLAESSYPSRAKPLKLSRLFPCAPSCPDGPVGARLPLGSRRAAASGDIFVYHYSL